MAIRNKRLDAVRRIIKTKQVGSQMEMMELLLAEGIFVRQSTLSRDFRDLNIVKTHGGDGNFIYKLMDTPPSAAEQSEARKHLAIEFSGNLAVIKTRPGYAMGLASDIDNNSMKEILATIAGDDAILVISREGYSREEVKKALTDFINR